MVVTDELLDIATQQLIDYINNNVSHLALGTDNTTADTSDTVLGTEIIRKARQEYTEGTDNIIVSLWVAATEGNSNDFKEVGTFNDSSGGTMFSRDTFTSFSKTNTKEFWADIKFQFNIREG